MATAKKAATAAGRKIQHRKVLKQQAIKQEMTKRSAVADFLTAAVAKPTKKKTG